MADNLALAYLPRTTQALRMMSCYEEVSHIQATQMGLVFRQQVAFLEDALGVPRHRLKRIVVALPTLLSYSVEDNLRPKVTHVIATHKYEVQNRRRDGKLFALFAHRRSIPRSGQSKGKRAKKIKPSNQEQARALE